MNELTRRALLASVPAVSVSAVAAAAQEPPKAKDTPEQADRQRVLACGLTDAEADCWELAGKLAGKFFGLPKLHPMDDHEVAHAIHVIQHKLLSRPTYRKYLELARKPKEGG